MYKVRAGSGSDSAEKAGVSLQVVSTRFPNVEGCTNPRAEPWCKHTRCRYHLEHRGYGEHHLNPTRDCALVVANEGSHTHEELAEVLGVSDERVRQIEESALRKLRNSLALRQTYDESE